MIFDTVEFYEFCGTLTIDSKEHGQKRLREESLLGTQKYFISEVCKGLREGVHSFTVLKGRQLGITTISLALDLYWHFKYPGMQGTLVSDSEENRSMFKTTIEMYIDSLPRRFRQPITESNRNQLVFKNRSRIAYQVAGKRKNATLGQGKGLTFLHSTETSSYGDEEGIASLQASLAEHNPRRLSIFESTAKGFNHFYDMWDVARRSNEQRAIFIGWWRNELYSRPQGSSIYETYWDGKMTTKEIEWVGEVKQLYGWDIKPEQLAWWRWHMAEKIKNEELMYQNFPPTANYAFIMSGGNFFSAGVTTDAMNRIKDVPFYPYRVSMRQEFHETELIESSSKLSNLRIWKFPVEHGVYVVGADPAYGSSEWADRFCIQVFRCYADGLEQVAEFCTTECHPYQFAWVIAYLCGAYGKTTMYNLEINGPGEAVLLELNNLKRVAAVVPGKDLRGIMNVVGNIQSYLYKRPDSLGSGYALHWKTTYQTKERMLNLMKDNFERGMMEIMSADCLHEIKTIVRSEGAISASGKGKDDRVIASALACVAWNDFVRHRCVQMGITKAKVRLAEGDNQVSKVTTNVANYLTRLGIKAVNE